MAFATTRTFKGQAFTLYAVCSTATLAETKAEAKEDFTNYRTVKNNNGDIAVYVFGPKQPTTEVSELAKQAIAAKQSTDATMSELKSWAASFGSRTRSTKAAMLTVTGEAGQPANDITPVAQGSDIVLMPAGAAVATGDPVARFEAAAAAVTAARNARLAREAGATLPLRSASIWQHRLEAVGRSCVAALFYIAVTNLVIVSVGVLAVVAAVAIITGLWIAAAVGGYAAGRKARVLWHQHNVGQRIIAAIDRLLDLAFSTGYTGYTALPASIR